MDINLFDGHCDTLSRCMELGENLLHNTGHVDLSKGAQFNRWAQFFAIFQDGGNYAAFQAQYALFKHWMSDYSGAIVHCCTAEEAEAAFSEGKRAAFLSVEGAELLDCDIERLREAYRLGVRAVNLTWNHCNALSGSNADCSGQGLTEQGRAFVREMNRLGMLVDVSHLSDAGFWDAVELISGPFVATHSNSRTIFYHPRNLTDGQFTAIIKCNGVAGLNLFSDFLGEAPTVEHMVAHIEHFWSLGGEKNVSIGGDWDGISRWPAGICCIGDIGILYEALLRRNHREALVRDLFYFNMMRVVKEVCTISAHEIKM